MDLHQHDRLDDHIEQQLDELKRKMRECMDEHEPVHVPIDRERARRVAELIRADSIARNKPWAVVRHWLGRPIVRPLEEKILICWAGMCVCISLGSSAAGMQQFSPLLAVLLVGLVGTVAAVIWHMSGHRVKRNDS